MCFNVVVPKARRGEGSSEVQLCDRVAGCDVDELSTVRSRRLAKCRRRKCRLRFRLLLLCGNFTYTYEEYKVEEAEKVLSALRRTTHFRSKFLDCTCNKLICSVIMDHNEVISKSPIFHLQIRQST